MKRSEMVDLIQYELHDMDFSYCDSEEVNEFASYLLGVLEKKGMAPPDSDYYRSSLLCPNRVWEPENET